MHDKLGQFVSLEITGEYGQKRYQADRSRHLLFVDSLQFFLYLMAIR